MVAGRKEMDEVVVVSLVGKYFYPRMSKKGVLYFPRSQQGLQWSR